VNCPGLLPSEIFSLTRQMTNLIPQRRVTGKSFCLIVQYNATKLLRTRFCNSVFPQWENHQAALEKLSTAGGSWGSHATSSYRNPGLPYHTVPAHRGSYASTKMGLNRSPIHFHFVIKACFLVSVELQLAPRRSRPRASIKCGGNHRGGLHVERSGSTLSA
jgi:hypothetical protein